MIYLMNKEKMLYYKKMMKMKKYIMKMKFKDQKIN